jgi:hypothetical protein
MGTVEEMEARMSSAEFTDWLQFFEWREWYRENEQRT